MDVKCLPEVPDDWTRCYTFAAIYRATRWAFLPVYSNRSEASATDLLERLHEATPMNIGRVLTDNISQLPDRFTSKTREPGSKLIFNFRFRVLCIQYWLCPSRLLQTNGLVMRVNGWINELVQQTRRPSAAELDATDASYRKPYS